MVVINFKFKEKDFEIKVKVCKSIFSKAIGLMFKSKSLPLLFIFRNANRNSIHSFFCVPFIGIWLLDGNVVDVKLIRPWRLSVRPKREFDKLLEIPINDINFKVILDEIRKV